ncbi:MULTISPECIES: PLDc N-terminal domain-containing protein [Actinomadura]|uniref:PLDc N-terminal domain-containing protein n=1 Tax=Actinomadura yumaensis TaxID=111807 RepID=A0ABW2CF57_9ACTN|nr:PLDc N-terminal domain-containing protein [Actinomadura sp. J1-007]MWK35799.1 hypothetical protein [Actinomadura sp. J1-007]
MAYALLALVLVGIWLFCLLDVLTTDETLVRYLPKFAWFLLVLLGFLAGAFAWLALGRPRRRVVAHQEALQRQAPGPIPRGAPRGPDDDDDFLRELDRRLNDDE